MDLNVGSAVFFRQSDLHDDDGTLIKGSVVEAGNAKYIRVAVPKNASHHYVQVENVFQFGFEIRNLIMVTDASHLGVIGQIVGTATTASGKRVFEVRLERESEVKWYGADYVFIDDVTLSFRAQS